MYVRFLPDFTVELIGITTELSESDPSLSYAERRVLALNGQRDGMVEELGRYFVPLKGRRHNSMRFFDLIGVSSLDKFQFRTDFARLGAGSVGIIGGSLVVIGIILTPFLVGTPLLIAGMVVGGAGSVAAILATATRLVKEKWVRDAFITLCKMDVQSTAEVQRLIEDIHTLNEKITIELNQIITSQPGAPNIDATSVISSVRLARLVSIFTYMDDAAQVAAGAGRLASRAIGVVFAALGIAVDAIEPNPWNPNRVPERMLAKLEAIQTAGCSRPD